MIEVECKQCGSRFKHNHGRIRCPVCGSTQVWIVGGISNVIGLTLLLAAVLLAVGFVALPPDTFRAEVVALVVAIPLVSLRYWLWRKPGTP
jgi:ribosomal protein S27E